MPGLEAETSSPPENQLPASQLLLKLHLIRSPVASENQTFCCLTSSWDSSKRFARVLSCRRLESILASETERDLESLEFFRGLKRKQPVVRTSRDSPYPSTTR